MLSLLVSGPHGKEYTMEDSCIVSLFFSRDESAVAETQKKYGAYIKRISMNILNDQSDSEENVNDTYLNAWNSIPPNNPERLAPFLGRIARNLALNRYKSRHAQKRSGDEFALSLDELDECIPSAVRTDSAAEASFTGGHISEFLRQEPRDVRSVFVCRYFYGEAIKNIACRFGYSESKVKSMLQRTRIKLKCYLEKEGITV